MAVKKLAILGGKPEFQKRVSVSRPNFHRRLTSTIKGIYQVLKSNMVVNVNIKTKELEKRLSELLNVKHVISVNSATSGLILTIRGLGLEGKEILVPSFSFGATVLPLLWNNCKIKFGKVLLAH